MKCVLRILGGLKPEAIRFEEALLQSRGVIDVSVQFSQVPFPGWIEFRGDILADTNPRFAFGIDRLKQQGRRFAFHRISNS
jgi:hypothetical protein